MAATKHIQDFHSISGLERNLEKTHVIPVGALDDQKYIICPEFGIQISTKDMTKSREQTKEKERPCSSRRDLDEKRMIGPLFYFACGSLEQ